MNKTNLCLYIIMLFAAIAGTSCEDSKSYAELLDDENLYVNRFLCNEVVMLDIPADTVFEVGEDAPYYRLDPDGNIYMQVLNAGTKGNKVEYNEQIYFRYTRWALKSYTDGNLGTGDGNNTTLNPCWFRYGNYQIQSSYAWGYGVQMPLAYLPIDCEVNVVIKASYGITSEQSDVQPYLWRLTYSRRQ